MSYLSTIHTLVSPDKKRQKLPELKKTELFLIAGIHGNEPGTILLLNEIVNKIKENPELWKVLGFDRISYILCANPSGLQANLRDVTKQTNPMDMNRSWNDETETDQYTKIREAIHNRISDCATFVVDLHCSAVMSPCFLVNHDQKHAAQMVEWSKKYHHQVVIRNGPTDSLKATYDGCLQDPLSVHQDVWAMTYEQNGMANSTNLSSDWLIRLTTQWLYDIIPDLYRLHTEKFDTTNTDIDSLRMRMTNAPVSGIWCPTAEVGDNRSEFEYIGFILCCDGTTHYVCPQSAGIVTILAPMQYVTEFRSLAFISPNVITD